jgi:hypothetical protein
LPIVERVLNLLPQLQMTFISLYSGWIFAFIALSLMAADARKAAIIPYRGRSCKLGLRAKLQAARHRRGAGNARIKS